MLADNDITIVYRRTDVGILILGLMLFLGMHLLPVMSGMRTAMYDTLGEKRYKGAFSLVSATGLALVVIGYARAPAEPRLFAPYPGAVLIAPLAMIISFVLLAAANMKTHIRRTLGHPMLIGVGIWAAVHLLANGEVRASILFGAFLAYVVIDLVSAVQRQATRKFTPQLRHDLMAAAAGTALALIVMAFHRSLFGVAVVP